MSIGMAVVPGLISGAAAIVLHMRTRKADGASGLGEVKAAS